MHVLRAPLNLSLFMSTLQYNTIKKQKGQIYLNRIMTLQPLPLIGRPERGGGRGVWVLHIYIRWSTLSEGEGTLVLPPPPPVYAA